MVDGLLLAGPGRLCAAPSPRVLPTIASTCPRGQETSPVVRWPSMTHAPTARAPQAGAVPVALEPIACPLCGGRETVHLASMLDFELGTPGLFALARCAGCGLLHQN